MSLEREKRTRWSIGVTCGSGEGDEHEYLQMVCSFGDTRG